MIRCIQRRCNNRLVNFLDEMETVWIDFYKKFDWILIWICWTIYGFFKVLILNDLNSSFTIVLVFNFELLTMNFFKILPNLSQHTVEICHSANFYVSFEVKLYFITLFKYWKIIHFLSYIYNNNYYLKSNFKVSKMIKLNSGFEMPALGFGTFLIKSVEVFYQALKNGYTHFDTATCY